MGGKKETDKESLKEYKEKNRIDDKIDNKAEDKTETKPDAGEKQYVSMYAPDWRRMAELIEKAKGSDRSMNQFARDCGLSPAYFTRIKKGTVAKPLPDQIIKVMVDNADNPGGNLYDSFMRANGKATAAEKQDEEKRITELRQLREKKVSNELLIKDILTEEISYRNHMFQLINSVHRAHEFPKSRFGLVSTSSFAVKIQGIEPEYWNFTINDGESILYIPDEKRKKAFENPRLILKDSMMLYAHLFLKDAWEPELLRQIKTSYVFYNEEIFKIFCDNFKDIRVNSNISFIMIDLEKRKIIKEEKLTRTNGNKCYSILDEDIVSY